MKEEIEAFGLLLARLENDYLPASTADFDTKPAPEKWSKKEIIGHLTDSAIHNIQRFNEIQYAPEPYQIRPYNQDALVKSNNYQNKHTHQLYHFWLQLNQHVLYMVKNQTESTLKLPLILPNGERADLEFLIADYFEHFNHHLKQINPEWI